MKLSFLFLTGVFLLMLSQVTAQSANPKYDKQLADSLGADANGMKMYVFVILKTGSNKVEDKAKNDSLFAGHMKNIVHLASVGKMVVAGPMANDKEYRGIFILNVKTIEEANALLELDPAIKAKVLDVELYRWYGSAALPLYLPSHDVVRKEN